MLRGLFRLTIRGIYSQWQINIDDRENCNAEDGSAGLGFPARARCSNITTWNNVLFI